MSEADTMTTTGAAACLPARPDHLEVVVNDLAGAASIACILLDVIRTDPAKTRSLSWDEGLVWLESRLSAATENLLAVQRRRAPAWQTTMEAESIAAALEAIPDRDAPQEDDNTPWLLTGSEPAVLLRAETPAEIELLALVRELDTDQMNAALGMLRHTAALQQAPAPAVQS